MYINKNHITSFLEVVQAMKPATHYFLPWVKARVFRSMPVPFIPRHNPECSVRNCCKDKEFPMQCGCKRIQPLSFIGALGNAHPRSCTCRAGRPSEVQPLCPPENKHSVCLYSCVCPVALSHIKVWNPPTVTDPYSLPFSLGELIEIKEQSYLCPSCSPSRQMHSVDDTWQPEHRPGRRPWKSRDRRKAIPSQQPSLQDRIHSPPCSPATRGVSKWEDGLWELSTSSFSSNNIMPLSSRKHEAPKDSWLETLKALQA